MRKNKIENHQMESQSQNNHVETVCSLVNNPNLNEEMFENEYEYIMDQPEFTRFSIIDSAKKQKENCIEESSIKSQTINNKFNEKPKQIEVNLINFKFSKFEIKGGSKSREFEKVLTLNEMTSIDDIKILFEFIESIEQDVHTEFSIWGNWETDFPLQNIPEIYEEIAGEMLMFFIKFINCQLKPYGIDCFDIFRPLGYADNFEDYLIDGIGCNYSFKGKTTDCELKLAVVITKSEFENLLQIRKIA